MAKRFKLKLSLSSFQFCRSNQTSSLPRSSLSSTFFSPINPKSVELSFPSFSDPPPTPNCPSKIMPPVSFNIECNLSTCDTQKMYNSPVSSSYDSDDSTAWPITPPKGHKKKNRRKKSKRRSISSADSGWFSSDREDHEINEEGESLLSSSENFDSSCDFGIPINNNTRKKNNSSSVKVRRLMRRYVSDSWKSGGGGEEIPVRKSSVFRRMMMSCAVEGKMKESFAVVKNSENPYEDFKGSMMEMILEKQMFEAKDLEQLLQCFLSLNSRHHHAAIVQAFSEIWEVLFQ